ncbi:MAG TPA: Uma2 family endonuclease [Roseiflexaceae bacterium]|nr:Uma2 family endonuclease [Roseiflexaceae bacterium]
MVTMTTWSRVEVAERMTAAEFWEEAPDDRKAELINGVMIMAPPPLDIHEKLQLFLLTLIRTYVEEHDLGEVRGSRSGVELAPDQVYEPDILFVARDRVGIIQRHGLVGAPDLVIEILSASTAAYDRGEKLRIYERAGVRELWLIDPSCLIRRVSSARSPSPVSGSTRLGYGRRIVSSAFARRSRELKAFRLILGGIADEARFGSRRMPRTST